MNKSDLAVGALIGAVLGTAAGMLYAPKSGEETRKQLREKAKKMAEKGSDMADRIKEGVGNEYEYLREELMQRYKDLDLTPDQRGEIKKEFGKFIDKIKKIASEE